MPVSSSQNEYAFANNNGYYFHGKYAIFPPDAKPILYGQLQKQYRYNPNKKFSPFLGLMIFIIFLNT